MPDYNQVEVRGVEYPRSYYIEIFNKFGVTPSITFHLESLTVLGDNRHLSQGLPSVGCEFAQEGVIPLLNPADGAPTGDSVSHNYLYQILFSLCEQLRTNTTP